MRVLITGGAGFIGSHLADRLLEHGHEVVALDDLSTGREENLAAARSSYLGERLTFVQGSVTQQDLVERLVAQTDVVFHLAAAVGVFTIQNETLKSIRTNVHGTETVLEAARPHGTRVIVASTSEIYGKNDALGLTEDADRILGSPMLTRWSYAEAKALDESMTQQYAAVHGLPATVVRPFNTAGPRQTGRYGMVVPRFVKQALEGEPLTVYGDGEQTRCFTHIEDVVDALYGLIEAPGSVGQVYNIGNPEQTSINQLARRIIERTGSASHIEYIDYETAYGAGYEDMLRRVPDCSRLHAEIGYAPRHHLDDIIDAVVAYASTGRSMALAQPA